MAREHTNRGGMSHDFGGSFLEDKLKMETFEDKLKIEEENKAAAAEAELATHVEEVEATVVTETEAPSPVVDEAKEEQQEQEIDLSGLPIVDNNDKEEEKEESPITDDDKEKQRIKKKTVKQNLEALIKPKKKTLGSVKMTFTVREDIPELMDSIFTEKDGKRKKGTWGLNKKIATNGIIKELVSLGLIEEDYLKDLEEYD